MELLAIENLLKIIASIVLWMAIGQTLLLGAIYFKLKTLFTPTRKQGKDNNQNKSDTINNRIKE